MRIGVNLVERVQGMILELSISFPLGHKTFQLNLSILPKTKPILCVIIACSCLY